MEEEERVSHVGRLGLWYQSSKVHLQHIRASGWVNTALKLWTTERVEGTLSWH